MAKTVVSTAVSNGVSQLKKDALSMLPSDKAIANEVKAKVYAETKQVLQKLPAPVLKNLKKFEALGKGLCNGYRAWREAPILKEQVQLIDMWKLHILHNCSSKDPDYLLNMKHAFNKFRRSGKAHDA